METLGHIHGLPGLIVAAVASGALRYDQLCRVISGGFRAGRLVLSQVGLVGYR